MSSLMRTEKHVPRFYEDLYICLLHDAADMCGVNEVDLERDLKRFRSRLASEGWPFLTEVLPSYAKALDRALAQSVPLSLSAARRSPTDQRPKFLWSFWSGIFDAEGILLPTPSVTHVRVLRQILYLVYKLSLPYDEEKNRKVLNSFEAVESELRSIPDSVFTDHIVVESRRLIGRLLCNFDYRDIRPRHGPGIVSTGEKLHRKMKFSRLYIEIERVFPYTDYFCSPLSDEVEHLEVLGAGTAKVILVPKDSRGPRLISCEPLEYQWLQQGVGRKLVSFLERHRWTAGKVNFTDQRINQRLATESSRTRQFATLDMKDASDRVSLALVESVFGNTSLLEALQALRSYWTRLPDGRRILLAKYAPMGSALCFPVEALCFWALAVSTLVVDCGYSRRKARESVFVYGDDIIVPLEVCEAVQRRFPQVGLMFNPDKCCTEGFFRESCGAEAYKGVSVKPTRLRTVWCPSRDPRCLAAYVSYSNSLYERGFGRCAEYLQTQVEALWGPLPYISCEAAVSLKTFVDQSIDGTISITGFPVIGFLRLHVFAEQENSIRLRRRYNRRLQRVEYLSWGLRPVYKRCPIDSSRELFHSLASGTARTRPGFYALRRRVAAIRRWSVTYI